MLCHVLLHHRTRDRLTTRVTQHNFAPTVTLVKDKHMSGDVLLAEWVEQGAVKREDQRCDMDYQLEQYLESGSSSSMAMLQCVKRDLK